MSVPKHLAKVPADAERLSYSVCPECGRRQCTYRYQRYGLQHWVCSQCGHEEIEPKAEDSP